MKSVVVTKMRSHCMWMYALVAAVAVVPILLSVFFHQPLEMMVLILLPVLIGVGVLVLYYTTWRLIFDSNGITRTVYRLFVRTYEWSEVRDVISRYSSADVGVIVRITFVGGESMKFRMDDENGEKARKVILSRHSIRAVD